jgi:hypothetical protein
MRRMNAIDKAREDRSRNLARLRKLTIGTAALGVAATTGFGYLAAMTYDGTTAGTTALVSTTSTTATTSSTTTSSTSSSTTAAPTVTTSSGTAHAASGGS